MEKLSGDVLCKKGETNMLEKKFFFFIFFSFICVSSYGLLELCNYIYMKEVKKGLVLSLKDEVFVQFQYFLH